MREARWPLLVLPLAYGRLSALQINVFLIVEIAAARARLGQSLNRGNDSPKAEELLATLGLIASEGGFVVADPLRVHRDSVDEILRTAG